ncbi:MAG: PAS domain S-box protein [Microscillaceae bacterium]|nr:PAS domain S-box protein [Microscillaceae bacterium]
MINFENIFYQLELPYCIFDQKGKFLSINAACEKLLGYTASEVLELTWWGLLHPLEQPDRLSLFEDIMQQGGVKFALCNYLIHSGEYVQMEWKFKADLRENIVFAHPKKSAHETLLTNSQTHLFYHEKNGTTITMPTFHEVFNQTQLIEKIAEAMPADLKLTDITKEQPLFSNHQLAEKLGYTDTEFIALGRDRLTKIVHPEDLDKFLIARNTIIGDKNNQVHNFEIRLKHKEGYYKWMIFTSIDLKQDDEANPVQFVTIAQDITELKQAKAQVDKFFALSVDLFAIAGFDGYFIKVNDAWKKIMGYSTEELLEKPYIEFIHPEDQASTIEAIEKHKEGPEALSLVNRYKHKDGTYRWLSWEFQIVREAQVIYATARDNTEKIEAERALKKLNSQLIAHNRKLIDKEEKLSRNNQKLLIKQSELSEAIQKISAKQELIEGIARAIPAELNAYDNKNNQYLFSNYKLAIILGYSQSEFDALGQDPITALIHPEDAVLIQKGRERLFQGEEQISLEIRLRHKQNHYKYVLISTVPLDKANPGQSITISQDIDRLKKAEQELIQLNEKLLEQNKELGLKEENLKRNNERLLLQQENMEHTLEKLLESQTLIEGIAKAIPAELNAFDVIHNNLVFSNHKLGIILGYSSEELDSLGPQPLIRLLHEEDQSILEEIRTELVHHQVVAREARARHKQGHYKWLSVIAVLLKDDSEVSRYVVILLQDITERKVAEEEIHTSNEKLIANQEILQRALTELSDRNFELDQLVYKISHDLRSPLSTILGLVNLMKLEKLSSEIGQYVNHIENRVLKLDGFVKSMLNYAKANRTQIKVELIDFEEIIFNCLADLEYIEHFKRVHTDIQIKGDKNFFKSDHLKIKVVFSNIISNAFKYMNPKVEPNFLRIYIQIDMKQAFIQFIDNGIGIHAEYIDKIFNMFFRATEKSDGSGLGMYIVKQTIDKLDGEITVESELGVGTTFKIRIPNLI